jgi:hypothetical protein
MVALIKIKGKGVMLVDQTMCALRSIDVIGTEGVDYDEIEDRHIVQTRTNHFLLLQILVTCSQERGFPSLL